MTPSPRLLIATLVLAATTTHAQELVEIKDPANLTGEHIFPQSPADTLPINHGAAALQQLLLKLRTRASMMLIVAHPDDEDGGLLTYESRGQGARVAMLTLTRGEGGQNLMSGDFGDALGLIRTQELLAADRYMGVDQFFGTEVDFGFSKTKEESFEKWTHERVLYDAVRAVRLYRPLVLASVFVGGPTDGHGHHQVSGEICQEVFKAAADPNVFPEMIKEGLLPWAPLKVYARVPFSRVTADGMYDYATGKTVTPRFENYVTGQVTSTPPAATVLIHEGDPAVVGFNGQPGKPALGMEGLSYVQFARLGLALQKTQIGQNVRLAPAGKSDTPYTLMGSRTNGSQAVQDSPSSNHSSPGNLSSRSAAEESASRPTTEQSLFNNIDTSLQGLASLAPSLAGNYRVILTVNLSGLDHSISEAQHDFNPEYLEASAYRLREAILVTDGLIAELNKWPATAITKEERFNLLHELRIKRVQLNNALVLALGITLEASIKPGLATSALVTTSRASPIHVTIRSTSQRPISIVSLGLASGETTIVLDRDWVLKAGGSESTEVDWASGHKGNYLPTRPYFQRVSLEQPYYDVTDPKLRNAPSTPSPLVTQADLNVQGVTLEVRAVVPAPVKVEPGEPFQPAVIVPSLSISLAPNSGIITAAAKPLVMTAVVTSQTSLPKATATVTGPAGWEGALDVRLEDRKPGQREAFPVTVTPRNYFAGQTYKLTGSASDAVETYREGFRAVGYPGLTYTNLYTPATYRATAVDVTTAPNLRVAYLPGTGDPMPDFLPNLGITPTLITPADLTPEKLAKFDAVLVGVRAYAAQSALAGTGSKPLLDYARNGGVVILQYMTARYGDAEAPYPISVPGDPSHNVVVEAQPVTVLAPDAPILNWPNKITASDFEHWVEERGHGFAAAWAPQYQALLETHDPDQDPQRGGLLLAPVGKGAYVYCALALYRQLPEGVPGAYRLVANLLSYAKNPHR